jgi:Flp pilus assembly protein TadB
MTPPVSSVVLGVVLLALGVTACVVAAFAPASPGRAGRERPASASTPSMLAGLGTDRLALGAAVGVVTLMASRWVVLALALAVLATLWGRLMRDDRAVVERRRVEGIATWLEDLRDTLRGSAVGAEEALEQVARRPPEALRDALTTYAVRRQQGVRTEDALSDLAEQIAHPTSDAAIAAIRLVVTGTTGSGRLFSTVDALAAAARDEVRARERIDRTRAVYQSSMKRLVVIAVVLIAYLRLAAGTLLAPYGSAVGQMVLAVPLAMWVGCIVWLRRLCRYELPRRYRVVGSAPVTSPHPAAGDRGRVLR